MGLHLCLLGREPGASVHCARVLVLHAIDDDTILRATQPETRARPGRVRRLALASSRRQSNQLASRRHNARVFPSNLYTLRSSSAFTGRWDRRQIERSGRLALGLSRPRVCAERARPESGWRHDQIEMT